MSKNIPRTHRRILLSVFTALILSVFCFCPLNVNASETTVFYTIQLKKLHPDVLSSLIVGARVTDSVSKSYVGKIENIAITPHMRETYSSVRDCMIQAPHPYFRDVTLTVRTFCTPQKNGYLLGSFLLFKGSTLHFFTADFTGIGECTAIYESENLP